MMDPANKVMGHGSARCDPAPPTYVEVAVGGAGLPDAHTTPQAILNFNLGFDDGATNIISDRQIVPSWF
jgi:hypothetical protein